MRSNRKIRRVAVLMAAAGSCAALLAGPAQAAPAPAASEPAAKPAFQADVPTLTEVVAELRKRRADSPRSLAPICNAGTIMSAANNSFVSAEYGWTDWRSGMLRARRPMSQGADIWELFVVCQYEDNSYTLTGYNGEYVSAEVSWTGDRYGVLRARRPAVHGVGPWERFTLEFQTDGTVAIKSLENGRYVSAELAWSGDNYGTLRARRPGADGVGPWERFW